jgi:hypothetical protein
MLHSGEAGFLRLIPSQQNYLLNQLNLRRLKPIFRRYKDVAKNEGSRAGHGSLTGCELQAPLLGGVGLRMPEA